MGLSCAALLYQDKAQPCCNTTTGKSSTCLLCLPAPCISTKACCMHVHSGMPQASGEQLLGKSMSALLAA